MTTGLLPLVLGVGVLLLASVLASRVTRFGIPALLLFMAVGMLAGSDGPGGIAFDNPPLAQGLGVVALAFILFSGGLDTSWGDVRPVLAPGLLLSTVGVGLTAGLTALFAWAVADLPARHAVLLAPSSRPPTRRRSSRCCARGTCTCRVVCARCSSSSRGATTRWPSS